MTEKEQLEYPQLISVREASRLLHVSTFTIRKLIAERKIQIVSLGPRLTRIKVETLNELVRNAEEAQRR